MHMKVDEKEHKEKQQQVSDKKPLRQKISLVIMALMLIANVCLIALAVI